MVNAQKYSSADSKKLTYPVHSSSDDDSKHLSDPAAYGHQGGGVVGVLNDLLEKEEGELDAARQKEQADLANFQMLYQSLTDEVKFANKEMDEAKKSKSESEESKAMATGDLEVTTKDLNNDVTELDDLHHNCMTKANDFEAETKSRAEELKALATPKKIIIEATSLAQTSFLQRSKISTRADLVNYEAVRYVHDLARKQHSSVLSQLASRLSSTVKFSTGSQADIFAKIKGLITDMVEKLEAEAEADATEKAYCDKELGETNMKKEDKTAEIEKLTAKIDAMTSESKQLGETNMKKEDKTAEIEKL